MNQTFVLAVLQAAIYHIDSATEVDDQLIADLIIGLAEVIK